MALLMLVPALSDALRSGISIILPTPRIALSVRSFVCDDFYPI